MDYSTKSKSYGSGLSWFIFGIGQDVPDMATLIPEGTYRDIFVLYPSSGLVEELAGQFGERMQILEGRRGPPTWIIDQALD